MPTYNRREFLPRAFRCFQAQDYPHLELIIVDDGIEPVLDLIPKDPRIKYYRLDATEGEGQQTHGLKMNMCMEVAKGDTAIVWDDDDWYASNRVTAQVAPFSDYDTQVTGNRSLYYYVKGTQDAFLYSPVDPKEAFSNLKFSGTEGEKKFKETFKMSNWVGAIAFRRYAWTQHKFQDKKFGADTEFLKQFKLGEIHDLANPSLLVCTAHKTNACRKHMVTPQYTRIPFTTLVELTKGDL